MYRRLVEAIFLFGFLRGVLSQWRCDLNIAPSPKDATTSKSREYLFLTNDVHIENHYDPKLSGSDVVDDATVRFLADIHKMAVPLPKIAIKLDGNSTFDQVDKITIDIRKDSSKYPGHDMDEEYKIDMLSTKGIIAIKSNQPWGVLCAFSTLILMATRDAVNRVVIPVCNVADKPKFSHRGFLIDTASRYWKPETIKAHIELMALHKFNILHWRIVGDNSFPYQSNTFWNMSIQGAFQPHYLNTYTRVDIASIVEFARVRGIRVIPEFDTRGHIKSWNEAIPNLLTRCRDENNKFNGTVGRLNPANSSTYQFLKSFFASVMKDFPDESIHLGGKNMFSNCWESNQEIKKFMEGLSVGLNNSDVETFYVNKLSALIKQMKKLQIGTFGDTILYNDVYNLKKTSRAKLIIQIWKPKLDWKNELRTVVSAGYRAIVSSCFHFGQGGVKPWRDYYNCGLSNFIGNETAIKLLIGGEAYMWSKYVDDSNAIQEMWPAGIAVAERLWATFKSTTGVQKFEKTMHNHMCKLRKKGIPASPAIDSNIC